MPYIKSRVKKDSLLILPYSELLWFKRQVGETLNFCTFKNQNTQTFNTLKHSKGKHSSCQLWQELPHLDCMVLSIASIITLIMLHYFSSIQNGDEYFSFLSKYQQQKVKFLFAIWKHKKVGNMILKKVYFPKSRKMSKQVSSNISVFLTKSRKLTR